MAEPGDRASRRRHGSLEDALVLFSQPGEAYTYAEAEPSLRKILNRAIFSRILIQVIGRRTQSDGVMHEVYDQLVAVAKALGMPPDAPADVMVPVGQARTSRNGRRRPRRPSTDE